MSTSFRFTSLNFELDGPYKHSMQTIQSLQKRVCENMFVLLDLMVSGATLKIY